MLLGWDLENNLPGWGWGQVEELCKPVPRKGLFCLFFFSVHHGGAVGVLNHGLTLEVVWRISLTAEGREAGELGGRLWPQLKRVDKGLGVLF